MSNPYVGEIRMFGGNFEPSGWVFCNGQLLPIAQYETLFQLIGTTYGGDGQSTFAVPDMRGRVPVHQGNNGSSAYVVGETLGTETASVSSAQMPPHYHTLTASRDTASNAANASGGVLASSSTSNFYGDVSAATALAASAVGTAGGASSAAQSHPNVAPFLTVSFIISLFGIFPSQN